MKTGIAFRSAEALHAALKECRIIPDMHKVETNDQHQRSVEWRYVEWKSPGENSEIEKECISTLVDDVRGLGMREFGVLARPSPSLCYSEISTIHGISVRFVSQFMFPESGEFPQGYTVCRLDVLGRIPSKEPV